MPLSPDWSKKVMKELKKHAERDDCYNCKELLRELAETYGVKLPDILGEGKTETPDARTKKV